jgi:hypothetical protein
LVILEIEDVVYKKWLWDVVSASAFSWRKRITLIHLLPAEEGQK